MASDDRLKGADLPEPYDVKRAFLRIEDELIASMMRNLGRHLKEEQDEGFDWSQWQVEQLKYLQEYRRRNRKVYGPRFQSINEKIEEAILHAHQNGQKEEELNILDAISKDKRIRPRYQNPSQASVEAAGDAFFRVNDKKLEALVKASHSDLEKAEHAVLRRVDDQYRRIIFDAQMYANTGAGTVEKAVDMATKDFLLKGIDSIQYKNGTRHTISDYADMYIRTAERRAYLMGEGKKRQEWGEQLVIVNRRGTMTAGNYGHACPLCIPWLGKILIDDVYSGGKPDGKHQLLSDAMAAGFLHPRCRDGFTTYFPGISPQEDPVTKKEVKEAVEAEKEENRLQYAERQQERYERLAEYSMDPENQRMYEARAEQWESLRNTHFRTGNLSTEGYVNSKRPLGNFRATPADKVVNLLRSDFKEWRRKLSEFEEKAVRRYTYNSKDTKGNELFRRLNEMLRGQRPYDETLDRYSKGISQAIKKGGLKRDVICYRSTDIPTYANKKVGEIFREPQFISTSVTKKGALNRKYKIIIYSKKGTRAAYIESLSSYKKQRELLIDKNTIFRVISKIETEIVLEVIE